MSGNTVLTVVKCSVNDLLRVTVSVASQFRKWYTGVIALLGVAYSNVVLGLHLITSFIFSQSRLTIDLFQAPPKISFTFHF